MLSGAVSVPRRRLVGVAATGDGADSQEHQQAEGPSESRALLCLSSFPNRLVPAAAISRYEQAQQILQAENPVSGEVAL